MKKNVSVLKIGNYPPQCKRVMGLFILLVLIAVLFGGCASTWKSYDGSSLKSFQVAVLFGGGNFGDIIVDDKELPSEHRSEWDGSFIIHLLPGHHELFVGCRINAGSFNYNGVVCGRVLVSKKQERLEFDALEGQKYEIVAEALGNSHGFIAIKNCKTGNIIASQTCDMEMRLQRFGFGAYGSY